MVVFLFLSIILSVASTGYASAKDTGNFRTEKSEHFIISYRCDKEFVVQTVKYCELYYDKIETDLGLKRFSNFWTWNKRCNIIIFADKNEYHLATGQPEWFAGSADYENRVIYTYPSADRFLDSLLPHELTHIMFREYVGNNTSVALWIDEGIAQYEEKYCVPHRAKILKEAVYGKTYIPFEELQRINNVITCKDSDFVELFYEQSRSIINFLIKNYGTLRFAEFIRQLKSGKDVNNALRFSYPGSIENMKQLEEKWIDSID